MFPSVPRPVFPSVHLVSQWWTCWPRDLQCSLPSVPQWSLTFPIFPSVLQCSPVHRWVAARPRDLCVPQCSPVFPGVSQCSPLLSGVSRCSPVCQLAVGGRAPSHPQCFPVFASAPGCSQSLKPKIIVLRRRQCTSFIGYCPVLHSWAPFKATRTQDS